MTYAERDAEIMKSIHDEACQQAKNTIATFLQEQNGFNKIDDLMNNLWTDTFGEASKDEIAVLLQAIYMVSDELLAWARKEQK